MAIISLIFLQYRWMVKARQLIEEQFNQKVSLAVCSAVQQFSGAEECKAMTTSCAINNRSQCTNELENLSNSDVFTEALQEALAFYDIDLPYEIIIIDQLSDSPPLLPAGCCPLQPIINQDNYYLSLAFPTKEQYFYNKLGFTLITSIIILLLIAFLFLFINYRLTLQKRIMKANKDFFNAMAHEFRTPLTNISLASQLIPKKFPEAKNNKYLQIIRKESSQLMQQVRQVLDYAKLEQGKFPLQKSVIDLKSIIQAVIDQFQLQIQLKNAVIKWKEPHFPCLVHGDPFHLKNVLKNLMDNALKHHPGSPTIEILLTPKGETIEIQFKDDGLGIPPENHHLIFDKFFSQSTKTKPDFQGFGIGLAYVKKIIELHGGCVRMDPNVVKGTSFLLSLPLNSAQAL